jgi:orotidine-5'-phosphate decarboxylase
MLIEAESKGPCELILALDVPTREAATALLNPLRGELQWVKVGLQGFLAHGRGWVEDLAAMGFKVFLDLKLHDIKNTVSSAIHSLKGLPVDLLTVHASGGCEMMLAAAEATHEHLPEAKVVAVTVLTSMDAQALAACGVDMDVEAQVLRLARLALESQLDGVVASPLELPHLRKAYGQAPVVVTPGIRMPGAALDEQKRTLSPAEARRLGSSYIVVGRPILKAGDPLAAVRQIQQDLRKPL